ncbi:MAG TPA: transcriptional repressor [Acidimicrobiales bacterium]
MDGERVDAVLRHMRARGGRITTALRSVVEVLDRTDEHLTAQDIAAAVQATHPAIHVSTIYRALDRLSEAGMVTHLHVGHAPVVYHLGHDHHGHLVCGRCGAVVDVPATLIRPVAAQVERDYGFTVEPGHLALGGLCSSCAESERLDTLPSHTHS